MPGSKLVNLRTDLKSLKYGQDRPGNGDSGQPYVVTNIPNRLTTGYTDDGFIRGGQSLATRSSAFDQIRIKKFFDDKPKGSLFITRQVRLQFSNPKLEVKKYAGGGSGLFGAIATVAAGAFNVVNELVPGPTRLYNNGLNTLAQVGANAFGQHFDRHGILPVQDDNSKYLAVVKHNNENGNNRLVGLKNRLIKPTENPQKFLNSVNFIINNVNALFKTNIPTKGLQPQDLQIDNYLGGPGSLYGLGRTLIRRFDITSNGFNKYDPLDEKIVDYEAFQPLSDLYDNSNVPDVFSSIARPILNPETPSDPRFQTSVKYDQNIPAGANPIRSSVSPTARKYGELKNAVEKLKKFPSSSIDNVKGRAKGLDPNSSTFKYYGTKRVFDEGSVALYDNSLEFERIDSDIMTVSFKAIDPFSLNEEEWLFSAYMKGFRDNFDASWNEYSYAGRSESFYTYGKFKRNVNFNLDIPCFNKTQLLEKHRALGQLASTTAGAYDTNGLLGGVILKIKLGGYLDNEYAILNNISYEIPDDSSWDIYNSNATDPSNKLQLAMYLRTSISLTIIHKALPTYKKSTTDSPNTGFFGHIKDTTPGYLNKDYKKTYSTPR